MTDRELDAYSIVDLPEQPFVGVTKTVTMTTIPDIADEIPGLIGWVVNHGHSPAGAPFLRYLVIDMAGELGMEAGVPVASPVDSGGDVESGVLPGRSVCDDEAHGPTRTSSGRSLGDSSSGQTARVCASTSVLPIRATCGPAGSRGTRRTRRSRRT
jgi:hypothetical protein